MSLSSCPRSLAQLCVECGGSNSRRAEPSRTCPRPDASPHPIRFSPSPAANAAFILASTYPNYRPERTQTLPTPRLCLRTVSVPLVRLQARSSRRFIDATNSFGRHLLSCSLLGWRLDVPMEGYTFATTAGGGRLLLLRSSCAIWSTCQPPGPPAGSNRARERRTQSRRAPQECGRLQPTLRQRWVLPAELAGRVRNIALVRAIHRRLHASSSLLIRSFEPCTRPD